MLNAEGIQKWGFFGKLLNSPSFLCLSSLSVNSHSEKASLWTFTCFKLLALRGVILAKGKIWYLFGRGFIIIIAKIMTNLISEMSTCTSILTLLKLQFITDYLNMYTKQTFSTSLRRIIGFYLWWKIRFLRSWQNSKLNTKIFWVRTVTDKERRAAQKIKYFSMFQSTHWENSQ